MTSDPVEGMARAMYERARERWPDDMPPWEVAVAGPFRSDVCAEHWAGEARAAWAYALAAMREPSEAVVSAVTDVEFDYPVADYNATISLYSREQVVAILTAAVDALAREHGLDETSPAAAPALPEA